MELLLKINDGPFKAMRCGRVYWGIDLENDDEYEDKV